MYNSFRLSEFSTAQKTIVQEWINQKETKLYVIKLRISIYKLFFFFFVCMLFLTEVLEGKTAMLLGMSQWNSNDLVEQIETLGQIGQTQGKSKRNLYQICSH